MKIQIQFIVCLVFLLAAWLAPMYSFSQPGNPVDPDPLPVPLGGIEILLGAGGVLGARKILLRKREKKDIIN